MGFVLVTFCASHKVYVRIQVPRNKNSISFFFLGKRNDFEL